MGLLRARCDAVMVGDGTARAEPEHVWTPTHLGGADAAAFEWLRAHEGRAPVALHVFCSLTGEIERHWAAVARDDIALVVATTAAAAPEARRRLAGRPDTEVVAFGDDRVDTAALTRWLLAERGVRSLLCEGGPHLYGSMIADGAVDDEFVTLSPVLMGGVASSGARRPSLVEGVGFAPGASPKAVPLSLRRAGEHLMLRSRVVRPA
jgi:riboflavin biosynthesis pyrimidine reductase